MEMERRLGWTYVVIALFAAMVASILAPGLVFGF
jgi:hypothetical protein